MVVPTTAASSFVESRMEALDNCWKKKSANRKAQKHSDGFGKLVFDQISLVIYCQSYACVLGNKMHGHFLKKGNNSRKSRENSEIPNTQPPIENDKDLNLSHPSVSY